MKKSLKLIPAIVMLLISAILVSTSTFAWFSMNTTVRVTGMQVTAKSNNTFLLIGNDTQTTCSAIQTAKQTTVDYPVTGSSAYVFPSKPVESSDLAVPGMSSATVITAATAGNYDRWYTANSNDPAYSTVNSSSVSVVDNARVLSSGNFADYVIAKKVYLTLAAGSDDANRLTVDLTNISAVGAGLPVVSGAAVGSSSTLDPVRVLVVANGTVMATLSSASTHGDLSGITLTDDSVVPVDIYIYYDGSADSVFTNNIANLWGAKFELTFNVRVVGS